MEKIEKYKAFDGTLFDSEKECLNYEKLREKQIAKAASCAKIISEFCNDSCEDCHFNIMLGSVFEPSCLFNRKPCEWDDYGVDLNIGESTYELESDNL